MSTTLHPWTSQASDHTELCKNISAKFWESRSKWSAAHAKIALCRTISASHSRNLAVMFLQSSVHGSVTSEKDHKLGKPILQEQQQEAYWPNGIVSAADLAHFHNFAPWPERLVIKVRVPSSVKTVLPGSRNGWLIYCVIVQFWAGQRNDLRVILKTWQECFYTTLSY